MKLTWVGADDPSCTPKGSDNRFVVIGDSVAYGHGLHNPYRVPMIGTGTGVSQGPSPLAWPSLVASQQGDSLVVRSSNCTLSGDQLSISGAQASAINASHSPLTSASSFEYQCPGPNRSEQGTELPVDNLTSQPADIVAIQGGADDIDFADCLVYELTLHRIGNQCVVNGKPTYAVEIELNYARLALASMIESVSPHARRVAVVDYYNPIPNPNDFDGSSSHPNGGVDPVCLGLQLNKSEAYSVGGIMTSAINAMIEQAVGTAQRAGDKNVSFVDISSVLLHHEICTGSPALFSGEVMSEGEFWEDLDTIVSCKVWPHLNCGEAQFDETEIREHSWRAAHPNVFGQQNIAAAVDRALSM